MWVAIDGNFDVGSSKHAILIGYGEKEREREIHLRKKKVESCEIFSLRKCFPTFDFFFSGYVRASFTYVLYTKI